MALAGVGAEAVRIDGLRETLRVLDAIGGQEMRLELKKAGLDAGGLVLVDAKSEAPVRTGRLRETIRLQVLKSGVAIRSGRASVPYSNPIHWGWVRRGIRPNPFLSRALGYNKDEIQARYMASLKRLVSESVTKYGKK